MSAALAALVRINAPGEGETPVTAGSTSSAAQQIPAGAKKLWFKATQKAHIRFGDAQVAEATANDQWFTADKDYFFDVPSGVTHWRAIRGSGSDALISWAVV